MDEVNSNDMGVKKILIVTNIPNPYRIPLFNELNKQLQEIGISMKVVFGSSRYSRRQFQLEMTACKFDYEILNTIKFHFGNREKTFFLYNGLLRLIQREKPDRVIVGGFSVAAIKLWLSSFLTKTHYIIWSGTTHRDGNAGSFFRKIQRKLLSQRAMGYIAYGTKARQYLMSMGILEKKIFVSMNTVDTAFFSNQTEFERKRISFGDEKKHLLYIGYLTKRKNVMELLTVIIALSKKRRDFVLDIIGDGEEKSRLEIFVIEKNIGDIVKFHGFKQKKELPYYMAMSSGFLFQTDFDIWGLVLNEAMAAGLPCISSVNAGATCDMIQDEVTGYAMNFFETEKVVNKINWLLDNPQVAKKIGLAAQRFIEEKASLQQSAKEFVNAIIHL